MLRFKSVILFVVAFLLCTACAKASSAVVQAKNIKLRNTVKPSTPSFSAYLICSADGSVSALSPQNGTVFWTSHLSAPPPVTYSSSSSSSSSPSSSSSLVPSSSGKTSSPLLPAPDGTLYAPSSSTSSKLRRLPVTVADVVSRSPYVRPDGALLLGSRRVSLHSLDCATGAVLSSTDSKTQKQKSRNIRLARVDYSVEAQDPLTGSQLWNTTTVSFISLSPRSSLASSSLFSSSFLRLSSTSLGGVSLLDPRTGTPFWSVESSTGAPVVAAYVMGEDGSLEEVTIDMSHPSDGETHLTEYNGQIYVVGNDDRGEKKTKKDILDSGDDDDDDDNNNALNEEFLRRKKEGRNYYLPSGDPYESNERSPIDPEMLRMLASFRSQYLLVILGIVIGCFVTGSIWLAYRLFLGIRRRQLLKQQKADGSLSSEKKDGNETTSGTSVTTSDGIQHVGKLLVNTRRILGRGSLGTIVYEGEMSDGRPVAVKRMLRDYCGLADQEITILLASDEHPNVVRYYSREEDDTFVYLALTLCTCSLEEWVEKRKANAVATGQFEITPKLIRLMADAAHGIAHIHSLHIVHRDIKPQNILIDAQGRARISDMGLAKHFDGTHFSHSIGTAGSTGWLAPEVLALRDKSDDTSKSDTAVATPSMDVFALGCVFHYMAVGRHPFGDPLERDANVLHGHGNFSVLGSNPILLNLVQRMTAAQPDRRPSAADVSRHPFFWSQKRCLQFLLDASDRLEVEQQDAPIVVQFEGYLGRLPELHQWQRRIDQALLADLTHHRRYKFDAARDLLRVIRNKSNHYYDLDEKVRNVLGSHPVGFFNYFQSRFPSLFICTYEYIRTFCSQEPAFRNYFVGIPTDE